MRGSIAPHKGQPDVWRLRVYLGTDPVTGKEPYRSKVVHAPKRRAEKILNQMDQEANAPVSTTSSMAVEQLLGHLIN
jgi:hypothetical protein